MSDPRPPRPADPAYRVFIDESGDHGYSRLDSPWHKHLGLLGVWFKRADAYIEFADNLTKIKRDIFRIDPDETLVFHASEIKGRVGPFEVLKDPELDKRFCAAMLNLVEKSAFTMALAVIDKDTHKRTYSEPLHPYHYAMTALMERYAFWLSENATVGDAVAESRGKAEDRELEALYRKVATSGTRYLKSDVAMRVFTSKSLKIKKKTDNVAGLQLADVLVLPLKRDALIERGTCPACATTSGFARELAAVARPKYRGYFKGSVSGYGRVWL